MCKTQPTAIEAAHYKALETLGAYDGRTAYLQLLDIEERARDFMTKHANFEFSSERFEAVVDMFTKQVFNILDQPAGFYINSDPRGHALKLDPEITPLPNGLADERPWNNHGILAPEF